METIKNYLDNMFAALPKTTQMIDLKNNILANMEDKYNELKADKKSENEAIGIVISEFGNIDELINELGIKQEETNNDYPVITQEEANTYLAAKKTMGVQIGIGVFLCILAPALLILLYQLTEDGYLDFGLSSSANGIPGVIALFILITIAVGIFIYSGMNFEKYQYIERGVQLPNGVKANLQHLYDSFSPIYTLSLITGVCLLVLSPVVLIVTSIMADNAASYGVVFLLGIVSIAVFLFTYFGTIYDGYHRLLKMGEYTEKTTKEDKVIGAVASIIWPLATAIFVFCGLVFHLWSTAWIVFPIVGILFGMFCAAYSIITDKSSQK